MDGPLMVAGGGSIAVTQRTPEVGVTVVWQPSALRLDQYLFEVCCP